MYFFDSVAPFITDNEQSESDQYHSFHSSIVILNSGDHITRIYLWSSEGIANMWFVCEISTQTKVIGRNI